MKYSDLYDLWALFGLKKTYTIGGLKSKWLHDYIVEI